MTQSPFELNQVAIASKDTLLQIWDISQQSNKPLWQARNLPNDELDLQIPIWDTSVCYLGSNTSFVACTAYGDIREYDTREGKRRPTLSTRFLPKGQDDQLLSKIIKSQLSDQHVFVANQEGHICMLDRKMSKLSIN